MPSTHRVFAKTSESPRPSLPHSATDVAVSPLLLSVTEAARLLNVSPRTVWSLTESGSLPHVRIGRRVLYPPDALRHWTEAQTRTVASHQS